VLEASYDELMKVDGVNANIATYLTMIHATGRYYVKNRNQQNVIL
jgi:hypothetical protein